MTGYILYCRIMRSTNKTSMKRFFTCLIALFFLSSLTGCTSVMNIIKPGRGDRRSIGVPLIMPYSGKRATVKLADFDIKTAKAEGQVGGALREMLLVALANSGRFIVVTPIPLKLSGESALREDRKDSSTSQSEEIQLQDKNLNADLIIVVTVEDFEPEASGGRAGVGGGGGAASGFLGGVPGTTSGKAQSVWGIHLLDKTTSQVLASGSIKGQAGDIVGVSAQGFFGDWPLAPGLSAYADTPMEKAIRLCIIEVVRYLSENVPEQYYRY